MTVAPCGWLRSDGCREGSILCEWKKIEYLSYIQFEWMKWGTMAMLQTESKSAVTLVTDFFVNDSVWVLMIVAFLGVYVLLLLLLVLLGDAFDEYNWCIISGNLFVSFSNDVDILKLSNVVIPLDAVGIIAAGGILVFKVLSSCVVIVDDDGGTIIGVVLKALLSGLLFYADDGVGCIVA